MSETGLPTEPGAHWFAPGVLWSRSFQPGITSADHHCPNPRGSEDQTQVLGLVQEALYSLNRPLWASLDALSSPKSYRPSKRRKPSHMRCAPQVGPSALGWRCRPGWPDVTTPSLGPTGAAEGLVLSLRQPHGLGPGTLLTG